MAHYSTTDPEIFFDYNRYPHNKRSQIRSYINTLDTLEVYALYIAQRKLASSFNILKSIGFQKWLKNKL